MTTLPSQTSGVRLGLDRTKFGPEVRIPSFTGGKVLRNALLFVCGAVFVLPLLWLIEASMDAGATRRLQFPDLTLDHFVTVTQPDKMMALGNSLLISLVATFVATIPSILAGYAFSRHHIPVKGGVLMLILFLSGVPINIMIIPVYQILGSLNLLSLIPTGIFLGVTALPFELYIIKNAIDAIPLDLEEAARIERANTAQILWRVVIPLAMPGIAAAAIFGFVNTWGNFLAPLVLISASNEQPSPIKIFGFMSADIIRYGDIAAYSIVYSAPVVALYLLSSRVFRSGFVLGGAVR
jgi:multiple sugar transport system permease protein